MSLMIHNKKIVFRNFDKIGWLKEIGYIVRQARDGCYNDVGVDVYLSRNLRPKNITPIHIVTLACVMRLINMYGGTVRKFEGNEESVEFLSKALTYGCNISKDKNKFTERKEMFPSLWNVNSPESLAYMTLVRESLAEASLSGKDLYGLYVLMDEIYNNITDHADAGGAAYSYIENDEEAGAVRMAFCDLGKGIKGTMTKAFPDYRGNFIELAVRRSVTSGTTPRNKGYGLDNVVGSMVNSGKTIKIISGEELFIGNGIENESRTWRLDFDFPGTLISLELPYDTFEDNEIIDEFNFD